MNGLISILFIISLCVGISDQVNRVKVYILFADQRDLIFPRCFKFVTNKLLLVPSLLQLIFCRFKHIFSPIITYILDFELRPTNLLIGSRQCLRFYKIHPLSDMSRLCSRYKRVSNNPFCSIHHSLSLCR